MKQLVLALLLGFSLSACAQSNGDATAAAAKPDADVPSADLGKIVAGSPEARAREAVQSLGEGVRIESIGPAPLPGFRQVVAGGTVLYVSDDGKYLFQGGLVDVAKRQDMSEAAMAQVRKGILASLPEADRIVFAPKGTPRHTVVVLTDIECGYCRKFHSEIDRYNALGIRVEYLAFPRAGLGSDDYRKMVAVWCAPDRRKALTDAKNDRPVALGACPRTPVDMQYRAGLRMGLEGTPMILALNGRMVGGYLPPERLAQRLDALDAP